MTFALVYHPDIPKDIRGLDRRILRGVGDAIQSRLTESPESHGKPLRGSLKGLWALRFGDFRIVYRITGKEVWILSIKNRRDVYSELTSRLDWKP